MISKILLAAIAIAASTRVAYAQFGSGIVPLMESVSATFGDDTRALQVMEAVAG